MKIRKIGKFIETPEIGYGCMGLSGIYGPADDEKSIDLIRKVVDLGITMIDSADAYGNGHNEELVGKALKGIRERVLLCTKFGQQRKPEGTIICGTPEYVREACEASLKRLGVDHIDLYYQHRVDKTVPIEETVGAMAELVKQGKVRYLGLSEVSVSNLIRAHKVHTITAVQSELSLWSRQDENDILPTCLDLGIGYVAYSPLGRGFLTGNVDSRAGLDPKDTRQSHPRFSNENIVHNNRMSEQIKAMAESKGVTPAQLSLAWVLHQGENIVPIPGTKNISRVIENIAASKIALSADELKKLDEIAPIGSVKGERYPEGNLAHIDR